MSQNVLSAAVVIGAFCPIEIIKGDGNPGD